MQKPTFLDLSDNSRTSSAAGFYRSNHTSPRIQHFDGDVPPSLSPLDAIAARSRQLAKELEETRKAGERRLSRLPPQVVTQSLTEHQKSRPPIFRVLSDGVEPASPPHIDRESAGHSPQLASPTTRPVSQHPRLSEVLQPESNRDGKDSVAGDEPAPPQENHQNPSSHPGNRDYFDIPRHESPPPLENHRNMGLPAKTAGSASLVARDGDGRQASGSSQPDLTFTLSPPASAFSRAKAYHDASDDDYTSSNAGSTFSQSRKLSSSSGVSLPHSPASPYILGHGRSASNHSTSSLSRNNPSRSHLNFSRPLSSTSLNNLKGESPSRNGSHGASHSPPARPTFEQRLRMSNSFEHTSAEGFITGETSSYTHTTYSLPRGRMADRTSAVFLGLSAPHFEWQEPMFPGSPPLEPKNSMEMTSPSPNPSARPSRDGDGPPKRSEFSFDFGSEGRLMPRDQERHPSSSNTPTGSTRSTASSGAPLSTSRSPPLAVAPPPPLSTVEEVSQSSRSNSTVRPTTARTVSNYQALSAEEHVDKAIELHQHGDLKESTYHLRIAAKQNHPTGMLLYALACRHGWGMRPNQKEGVQWLRKAVDTAILEVADDENPASDKPPSDYNEKKTHRAQFALSIYELGVSHLNGWGIEQDKALALRCFEIAGNWGDTDALTEAGFCYAEGIGCKKDLKKAAKFYRMAEAKGVSMVGNSWIHKEKYNDADDDTERKSRSPGKTSLDKPRNKSKTRSFFGRKKSTRS